MNRKQISTKISVALRVKNLEMYTSSQNSLLGHISHALSVATGVEYLLYSVTLHL